MFGKFGKMLSLLGEMKTRIPEMQARLAASEYSAEAGEGAVTVTVNGKMQIVDVTIGPDALADAEMLAEMVKAAAATAQGKAAEAAREAMQEITGGMDLPAGLDSMLSQDSAPVD